MITISKIGKDHKHEQSAKFSYRHYEIPFNSQKWLVWQRRHPKVKIQNHTKDEKSHTDMEFYQISLFPNSSHWKSLNLKMNRGQFNLHFQKIVRRKNQQNRKWSWEGTISKICKDHKNRHSAKKAKIIRTSNQENRQRS